jgi:hypothetical protein
MGGLTGTDWDHDELAPIVIICDRFCRVVRWGRPRDFRVLQARVWRAPWPFWDEGLLAEVVNAVLGILDSHLMHDDR